MTEDEDLVESPDAEIAAQVSQLHMHNVSSPVASRHSSFDETSVADFTPPPSPIRSPTNSPAHRRDPSGSALVMHAYK
jgi:hypothetical protein